MQEPRVLDPPPAAPPLHGQRPDLIVREVEPAAVELVGVQPAPLLQAQEPRLHAEVRGVTQPVQVPVRDKVLEPQ